MSLQDYKLPGFVLGWAIVDLVFCGLRLFQVPFSALALFVIDDVTLQAVGVLELVTVAPLGLVGVPAAILILCKRRLGLTLGYLCAALTALSLITSIITPIMMAPADGDAATVGGFAAGVIFSLGIRVSLLLLYIRMLLEFKNFLAAVDEDMA